jgi:hypothetical protein
MRGHNFSFHAFITEELDGSFGMHRKDPRTEDWEHLYRDVHEGSFLAITDSENGIFESNDKTVGEQWLIITNGRSSNRWYSKEDTASILFCKWYAVRNYMDSYINTISEVPKYSFEDVPKINLIIEKYGTCKYVRHKESLFVIEVTKENIPVSVIAIVKKEQEILAKVLGKIIS